MKKKYIYLQILIFIIPINLYSQGPNKSYYYNPQTKLPWASAKIYFEGGSEQKIFFTSVINKNTRAPFGTNGYLKDVNLESKIVFIVDGISVSAEHDCYNSVDVENKFVMFYCNFPDTVNKYISEVKLNDRIEKAIERKALGIIIISYHEKSPFYKIGSIKSDIPIIVTNSQTASYILASSGRYSEQTYKNWMNGKIPKSRELISNLRLNILGKYDQFDGKNFKIIYHSDYLNNKEMKEIFDLNEKSMNFLLELFKEVNFKWKKTRICYFNNYDSKLFYTCHWGSGLSDKTGNYNVYNRKNNYDLLVHENTHSLIRNNIGGQKSFFNEGIAMYAQAKATNKDMNHLKTIEFLKNGRLYSLTHLISIINIGSNPEETEVAYPASGSFVDFLIDKYGLVLFTKFWQKSLNEVYGKNIHELEKEWLYWLKKIYNIDKKSIEEQFKKLVSIE